MLNKQFKELKSTKDTLTNNLNQLKQEIIDMNDLHSRKDAERMAKIAVLKNGEKNYNPMPVQVEVQKINPYNVVYAREVTLDRKGQEVTVVRFTINEDGSVTNFNTLSYGIVGRLVDANSGQWQPGGL